MFPHQQQSEKMTICLILLLRLPIRYSNAPKLLGYWTIIDPTLSKHSFFFRLHLAKLQLLFLIIEFSLNPLLCLFHFFLNLWLLLYRPNLTPSIFLLRHHNVMSVLGLLLASSNFENRIAYNSRCQSSTSLYFEAFQMVAPRCQSTQHYLLNGASEFLCS